jgi:hypothetical protein
MLVLAARPEQIMALATVGATYDGMGNLKEAERWYSRCSSTTGPRLHDDENGEPVPPDG